MSLLLNLIYLLAMVLLSPWLAWRIVFQKKNRAGFGEKFLGLVPIRAGQRPCIWFHAVSVGEVKLLQPVIDKITQKSADIEIVVSSTTKTGRKLAAELYANHTTFYSPLDFSWAVKRTLKRIRPSALVLAELELWPNLIQLSAAAEVPVCVINGRLSEKSSRRYHKFSFLVGPMFRKISWVGAQSQHYATRFVRNGCDQQQVSVTGSVKFDGVQTDRKNTDTLRLAAIARRAGIDQKCFTFVAGSTQLEEDLMAVEAWREALKVNHRLRLILVPRHPGRSKALAEILRGKGVSVILRSSIDSSSHASKVRHLADRNAVPSVLIVDVIGELSAWWGIADSGFVGGSMGSRGGQSMIEPAGFGVPVCFGPNTKNFADTVGQLIDNEAAEEVLNEKQLLAFMMWSFQTKHLSTAMGERAQAVVCRNMGAAQRTAEGILTLLKSRASESKLSNTGTTGGSGSLKTRSAA